MYHAKMKEKRNLNQQHLMNIKILLKNKPQKTSKVSLKKDLIILSESHKTLYDRLSSKDTNNECKTTNPNHKEPKSCNPQLKWNQDQLA